MLRENYVSIVLYKYIKTDILHVIFVICATALFFHFDKSHSLSEWGYLMKPFGITVCNRQHVRAVTPYT